MVGHAAKSAKEDIENNLGRTILSKDKLLESNKK